MQLDARKGDTGWGMWDCEACRELAQIVWVDDELNAYGQYVLGSNGRPVIFDDGIYIEMRRVRKIQIIPQRRMVLINPIDDAKNGLTTSKEAVECQT